MMSSPPRTASDHGGGGRLSNTQALVEELQREFGETVIADLTMAKINAAMSQGAREGEAAAVSGARASSSGGAAQRFVGQRPSSAAGGKQQPQQRPQPRRKAPLPSQRYSRPIPPPSSSRTRVRAAPPQSQPTPETQPTPQSQRGDLQTGLHDGSLFSQQPRQQHHPGNTLYSQQAHDGIPATYDDIPIDPADSSGSDSNSDAFLEQDQERRPNETYTGSREERRLYQRETPHRQQRAATRHSRSRRPQSGRDTAADASERARDGRAAQPHRAPHNEGGTGHGFDDGHDSNNDDDNDDDGGDDDDGDGVSLSQAALGTQQLHAHLHTPTALAEAPFFGTQTLPPASTEGNGLGVLVEDAREDEGQTVRTRQQEAYEQQQQQQQQQQQRARKTVQTHQAQRLGSHPHPHENGNTPQHRRRRQSHDGMEQALGRGEEEEEEGMGTEGGVGDRGRREEAARVSRPNASAGRSNEDRTIQEEQEREAGKQRGEGGAHGRRARDGRSEAEDASVLMSSVRRTHTHGEGNQGSHRHGHHRRRHKQRRSEHQHHHQHQHQHQPASGDHGSLPSSHCVSRAVEALQEHEEQTREAWAQQRALLFNMAFSHIEKGNLPRVPNDKGATQHGRALFGAVDRLITSSLPPKQQHEQQQPQQQLRSLRSMEQPSQPPRCHRSRRQPSPLEREDHTLAQSERDGGLEAGSADSNMSKEAALPSREHRQLDSSGSHSSSVSEGSASGESGRRAQAFVVDLTPSDANTEAQRRRMAHKQRLVAQKLRRRESRSAVHAGMTSPRGDGDHLHGDYGGAAGGDEQQQQQQQGGARGGRYRAKRRSASRTRSDDTMTAASVTPAEGHVTWADDMGDTRVLSPHNRQHHRQQDGGEEKETWPTRGRQQQQRRPHTYHPQRPPQPASPPEQTQQTRAPRPASDYAVSGGRGQAAATATAARRYAAERYRRQKGYSERDGTGSADAVMAHEMEGQYEYELHSRDPRVDGGVDEGEGGGEGEDAAVLRFRLQHNGGGGGGGRGRYTEQQGAAKRGVGEQGHAWAHPPQEQQQEGRHAQQGSGVLQHRRRQDDTAASVAGEVASSNAATPASSEQETPAPAKLPKLRSNVIICKNALASPACLGSGDINAKKRETALRAVEACTIPHLVIVLRTPTHLKFRGIYAVVPEGISKIFGSGPRLVTTAMVAKFFRYDSGAKAFKSLPSRDFTVCDAVALRPAVWQKKDHKPNLI